MSRAIEKIHGAWTVGKERRLTQLVFCDLSTPNPDRFNVYDEVRDRLIGERRIPAEGNRLYPRRRDRQPKESALFDAVNAGRVRILLGSTEKMGAGTNVQKRLIALHHLDAPWRPRDIEQRRGPHSDGRATKILKSRFTAMSPKDRSTPICGSV